MAKLRDIRFLAEETAKEVSGSPKDWMGYLDTASRLYRYPFSDTLLIHAQRPEATACAELEVWNEKMRRWVNRGAKGIALLDDTGPRMAVRYVFDIADTHLVRGGRTPYLWQLQVHQREPLLEYLADTYGLAGDTADLNAALMEIAGEMAQENLEEALEGMQYELSDTFLEDLDEDTIRVEFRTLLTNSAFYSLSRRCGLDPMEYLEEEDFIGIADFNALSVLTFLGNATSQLVQPVLRDIGRRVRKFAIEEMQENSQKAIAKTNGTVYNEFNTLKRESKDLEGGNENGTDIPPQGGLPVSESDRTGGDAGDREIRDAAEDVPQGEPSELVPEHDADREAEPAPAGDGRSGAGEDGSPDEGTAGEVPGSGQGGRPDGVDSAHEQPDGDGGGERFDGIGLHLTGETSEQDLSEAEEETASALSLPEFPTASAQIRQIEERMAALYAGEIAIPAEVVDEVLRGGGNRKGSQLRIIYNFMIDQTPEEYTDFVRREYGTGGIGLEIGGTEYSVWFDELGMQIAVGHTVNDRLLDKAFLSWEDVSGRIHQLLNQGEYAPQVVLDAARGNALTEHATALSFMERDMAEGVAELVFSDVEPFRGVYPDIVDRLSGLIAQPEYLADLNERLEGLAAAYAEDRSVMRFHHYRPDRMLAQLRKFAREAVPYQARDGFAWEEHPVFITEDEIDAFLAGNGSYSDRRLSVYAFFMQDKSDKEKADFLRRQYGEGGVSHALSGADKSYADYNAKGLKLARGDFGNPTAEVLLKWPKAAKRVEYLIGNDRYLKAADYSRMPEYEREQLAGRIIVFYHRMPEEIERPYEDDFFGENARKVLPALLAEPDTAEKLVAEMDAALAALPLDFEDYEKRAETLSVLHQYVEGTYTIFPERKKEVQIEGSPKQLSLFDFMDMGTQEPESARRKDAGGKAEPIKETAQGPENPNATEKKPAEKEPEKHEEPQGTEENGPAEKEPVRTETPETDVGSAVVYPGEKTHLPYDIVIEKLHFEEPEKDVPEKSDETAEEPEADIPLNAILEIDGREFRIDSVDYANGKVSLQDMTIMKEARYPIFRVEPVESVRFWLEQSQERSGEPEKKEPEAEPVPEYQEVPEGEAISAEERQETEEQQIEQGISEAMEQADAYFEDFSPEQMDVVYAAAERGFDVTPMLNPDFPPEQMQLIADVLEQMAAEEQATFENEIGPLTGHTMSQEEINAVRKERHLPLETAGKPGQQAPEVQIERQDAQKPEAQAQISPEQLHNFRITDNDLGAGGPKQKFRANMDAIYLLTKLEEEGRLATPEEQEILSRFVGWGGIPQAFDENNQEWAKEYAEVKSALTPEEYRAARGSTLNAFYTSPTVIGAMYEALGEMGLKSGNVLEPSCGVGNFMGLLPEKMADVKMYGVELDSISGRIARQLYQRNSIAVQGFETTDYPESFFDCIVGNVPFGQYKVNDRKYDRHNFLIHDYFIAKSLDLVRPGGVVAVVTSNGTMDKQNPAARKYFADRADLIGAIRLPNNAFMRNANTGVVADILFFQKRDRVALETPKWVELGTTPEGYSINSYFAEHPEMVLGEITTESTQYGKQETTVKPVLGANLAEQLKEAIRHIKGTITEPELEDSDLSGEDFSIPADPAIKNFSFANVDGQVYYRENSRMNKVELPAATAERVLGMIALRDITQELLQCQMEDGSDAEVAALQQKLNGQYDRFTARYGLIGSTANRRAFSQDSSYCLLSSLEILDEEGRLKQKADIFTKRTIRKAEPVTSVDTASEALAVSIGEKARVDVPFMAQLAGKNEDEITEELRGVIFKNPLTDRWETSDEYLSGNVREKLRIAKGFAENHPEYEVNVQCLERVQPKDLEASEIEVRLGATWVKPEYITQFMGETFHTPRYLLGSRIDVKYAKVNGQWNISGKNNDSYGNPLVTTTYGTGRANAYRLLEDALNLKDTKIYDKVEEDGKEKRVLNKKETMLAQQKQEVIKEAFKEWIFRDIDRREDLCRTYNDLFNSVRPREFDGSHIRFVGMTPEITLMQHQKNAVAHILYGNNTMLAHCVGAGKTFQMIAAGMESKRLGLCQKSLYVVPNHLTEQWGSDFLRLYPGANVLVATKKDFEPANRKKFCSRIATGNYDAIIIGHSQFEKIPLSRERQIANIERQIDDITMAIAEASAEEGSHYTVKQMEKTRKSLESRLERLNDQSRKDNVVTFEQLGVDRLFVDESHFYKNLFLYTKMRNVAGISQTDAQKSNDMFMKCQYLDEITGGRGVTFATGTPVSNSMVELYTIMRYLQYDTLQKMGLGHFDSWAATFGETVTAIEIAPVL